MSGYVYRYIDLRKKETIYIGYVQKCVSDIGVNEIDKLIRRHKQHVNEDTWFNKKKKHDYLMQYIRFESSCDAKIMESWLINQYEDTGQLENVAETGCANSVLNLSNQFKDLKWSNYMPFDIKQNCRKIDCLLTHLQLYEKSRLPKEYIQTEIDIAIESFEELKILAKYMLDIYEISTDFSEYYKREITMEEDDENGLE